MILHYPNKRTELEILSETKKLNLVSLFGSGENKLIKGNNLQAMKSLLEDFDLKGKIDLIYIDPPFATKNVFTAGEDRVSTISSKQSDTVAYSDVLVGEAFLEFLRERLLMAYELLSEKGPSNNPLFEMGVYLDDVLLGKGKGKTKKKAEQSAAKEALGKLVK